MKDHKEPEIERVCTGNFSNEFYAIKKQACGMKSNIKCKNWSGL